MLKARKFIKYCTDHVNRRIYWFDQYTGELYFHVVHKDGTATFWICKKLTGDPICKDQPMPQDEFIEKKEPKAA